MSSQKQPLRLVALVVAFFSAFVHADEGISYPAKIAGKSGIGLMNAATWINPPVVCQNLSETTT